MMTNPADEKKDAMEAHQICAEIKKLIAREKSEGDDSDVEKLQQAYDLCEEVAKNEGAESSPSPFKKKEVAPKKNNASTMSLDALKAKLPVAPPSPMGQGNLNAY